MNNKWGKGFGIFIAIALAVGINILGFTKMKQNQQEQRIEQAILTITSQKKQLESIQTSINQAYSDKNHDLLKKDLTSEDVKKLENELNRLKVTAEDFALSQKDLPADVGNLSEEKAILQQEVQDVSDKMTLQTKIQELFMTDGLDWQNLMDDVVIKKDTNMKKITVIRESMKIQNGNQWNELANQYLEFAAAQSKRVEELTADFKEMLEDGVITEAATYERYLALTESVAQVRNSELQETFKAQTNQISEQLGLGTTYYSTEGPSNEQPSNEETFQEEENY